MTTQIDNSIEQVLANLNLTQKSETFFQQQPVHLAQMAVKMGEGTITSSGALMCKTGKFTGRSPKDRYIVADSFTQTKVDWGKVNIPFEEKNFDALYQKMTSFIENKRIFVRYAYAGADPAYRLKLCVVTTLAWHDMFAHNMFICPNDQELESFEPEFTVICVPDFMANPEVDGTKAANFSIINLSKKVILIGGTAYAGEIKKGVFSALNFLLPQQNILPMHCSANIGKDGDVALFFGLSGTGKTTLSADESRSLIGDDEHGWSDEGVFNFEGGCYAKVINLSPEKEPEIYNAISFGAIVENTVFKAGTNEVDYDDTSLTENTRTSYPLEHIKNVAMPSIGSHPKNIFFLTCDAFGVLPPIAKLSVQQTMDFFSLGYTAKVAGTEVGVTEPQATFSACFGAAFMPLPTKSYASMLGEKLLNHDVDVWLINTGWTGGGYGVGNRISLKYTRAMIREVLEGNLAQNKFVKNNIFELNVPAACPNVPQNLLNPRETWSDVEAYDAKAKELCDLFFQKLN